MSRPQMTSNLFWQVLSNDLILIQILKQVRYYQLAELRLVNRQWNHAVLKVFHQLDTVFILPKYCPQSFCNCIDQSDYEDFDQFIRNTHYSLGRLIRQVLFHTPNLKALKICGLQLQAFEIKTLFEQPFMRTLKRLEIFDCFLSINDNQIQDLIVINCGNLEQLTLQHNFLFNYENNNWLKFCRQLRTVRINHSRYFSVSTKHYRHRFNSHPCESPLVDLNGQVVTFDKLTALYLTGCDLHLQNWSSLSRFAPNLQTLAFSESRLKSEPLQNRFPVLNSLIELRLNECISSLNDVLEIIGQRYQSTLKVLCLFDCCVCQPVFDKTIDRFGKLEIFRHCKNKCEFDELSARRNRPNSSLDINCNANGFHQFLTAFGSLSNLRTFESHHCAGFADFSLIQLIESGTSIRNFKIMFREDKNQPIELYPFNELMKKYSNERFNVIVGKRVSLEVNYDFIGNYKIARFCKYHFNSSVKKIANITYDQL